MASRTLSLTLTPREYRELLETTSARYVQNLKNKELANLRNWLIYVGYRHSAIDVTLDPQGLQWNVVISKRADFSWFGGQIQLFDEEQADLDRLRELLA
jgi:hypothetical protein